MPTFNNEATVNFKDIRPFVNVGRFLSLLWSTSRWQALLLALFTLAQGLLPVAEVALTGRLIDAFAGMIASGDGRAAAYGCLALLVLAMAAPARRDPMSRRRRKMSRGAIGPARRSSRKIWVEGVGRIVQQVRKLARPLFAPAAALLGLLILSPGALGQGEPQADFTILIRGSNLSDALRQVIDEFAAERGITVNYVLTGSWPEHFEQMLLMHLGGIPFDVTFVDQTYVPNAARGILADLTPYVERDEISLGDFVPLGVESFRWRGALYALPSYVSNLAMGYNADIFAGAGLPGIVTDWDANEFAWDDFVEIGKKLTVDRNGDGELDQWALRRVPPWRIAPFLFAGDWVDADGQLSLSSPEVVRSIEAFAELVLEHGVVHPSESSSALAAGQIAMEPVGQYTIRTWDSYDWSYSVGVMPQGGGPGTRSTILYADGFAMGSQSRNPQLAWEFIKTFVTDPGTGMAMPRHAASVPAYMPLHAQYLEEVNALYPSVDWVRFSDGLFKGKVFKVRFSPNFDQIEAILNDVTAQVFAGEKPARTALAEVERQVLDLWNRD